MASAVVLFLMPGSGRVLAQSAGASPVTVTWDNGLSVASGNGDNIFQLGGLVQIDGRFAPDDPLEQVEDEFVMRRVRTIMQGRIAKYFEFRLMPDFGNGTTVLYNAYFDVRFSQAFRVRIGKDKTPVGLEQLYPTTLSSGPCSTTTARAAARPSTRSCFARSSTCSPACSGRGRERPLRPSTSSPSSGSRSLRRSSTAASATASRRSPFRWRCCSCRTASSTRRSS